MNPHPGKEHKISEFLLKNSKGISVKILSFGGIIQEINLPNKNGFTENVVLSYINPKDYTKDNFYMGALIGRYANRISKSSFELNEEIFKLTENESENHLHGGYKGFHNVNWSFDKKNIILHTMKIKINQQLKEFFVLKKKTVLSKGKS